MTDQCKHFLNARNCYQCYKERCNGDHCDEGQCKLEKCWCKSFPKHSEIPPYVTMSILYEAVQPLHDKINNLEELERVNQGIIERICFRLVELESWVGLHENEGEQYGEDFEKRDKDIISRLEKLEESNRLMSHAVAYKSKQPHKCPVCEGVCRLIDMKSPNQWIICKVCDAKGIVWG